jgi:hypothetical protein
VFLQAVMEIHDKLDRQILLRIPSNQSEPSAVALGQLLFTNVLSGADRFCYSRMRPQFTCTTRLAQRMG